jgi:hypothetical protein
MTLPFLAWLDLREEVDAEARSGELVDPLRRLLAAPLVIRDLGCGTGSMGRWLASRLPGPQRWILYDRDAELLARAAGPGTETEQRDITTLTAGELAGTSLVTTSALLDLLTGEEVDRLAAACVEVGCPALLTLSVTGLVALTPADPLDGEIAAAFNAHQRRTVNGRRLLGPDGPDTAAEAFARRGATVRLSPSPWRLGPAQAALAGEWLRGWVGAASEHRPDLATAASAYLDRRLAAAAAGELRVVVGHSDLLAYRQ